DARALFRAGTAAVTARRHRAGPAPRRGARRARAGRRRGRGDPRDAPVGGRGGHRAFPRSRAFGAGRARLAHRERRPSRRRPRVRRSGHSGPCHRRPALHGLRGGLRALAMSKSVIRSDRLPTPVASYSPAVRVGQLVFVSGQIPLEPATGQLVSGDIEAQTRRVLDNLGAVLEAAGLSYADVAKVTAYLADMQDFAAFDAVYRTYFPVDPPARATVSVLGLPRGARLEVEAIAVAK